MRNDKLRTIRTAHKMLGLPDDIERSISFEEFCAIVAASTDAALNEHWRSQWRFSGTDPAAYDHVGVFEHLDRTFAVLTDKFGYVPETDPVRHTNGSHWNITRHDPALNLDGPHKMLPKQLLKYKASGFPSPEHFITPDLMHVIRKRFAADVTLHETALALSGHPHRQQTPQNP